MSIASMLDAIIRREGSAYTDDPYDNGGATKYGITQNTLSAWRQRDVPKDEVKALTENEARQIYTAFYLVRPGFQRLEHEDVQAMMLDAAVQHGPEAATKMLQRALKVKDDGVLGQVTLTAAHLMNPRRLCVMLLAQRARYYGRIITNDPTQARFAAGWMNRLGECMEQVA